MRLPTLTASVRCGYTLAHARMLSDALVACRIFTPKRKGGRGKCGYRDCNARDISAR